MNNKKRLLSVLLVLVMIVILMPSNVLSVKAAEVGDEVASGTCGVIGSGADIRWILTKNGVDENDVDTYTLTISGSGAVPDYPKGQLPEWACYGAQQDCRKQVTKIVIGSEITKIGNYFFCNCENVKEVVFEKDASGQSSVETIGIEVFGQNNALTEIVIPASVKKIDKNSFFSCQSLSSVVFEEGSELKVIGDSCFFTCHNMVEITLPSKVSSIGQRVFKGNASLSKLKRIYYPVGASFAGEICGDVAENIEYCGAYKVDDTTQKCSINYVGINNTSEIPDVNISSNAEKLIVPSKIDGFKVTEVKLGDITVEIPEDMEVKNNVTSLEDVEALEGWTYEAEEENIPAGGSVNVILKYFQINDTQSFVCDRQITVTREVCTDADRNHECDGGCGVMFGICEDADQNHECDYCGDTMSCNDEDSNHICDVCGLELEHNYSVMWRYNASGHWHECSCGKKGDESTHISSGEATETTPETCTICGYEIASAIGTTTEEPTTDEPTIEETTEESTTEESTTEESTTEESTTEESTTEESTTEAPTTEALTTEESTTEAPTAGGTDTVKIDSPTTGDNSPIGIIFVFLICSGVMFMMAIPKKKI